MGNQTILESAKAYQPKQTYNISELPAVDVNLMLEDREGKNDEGETFYYKVTVIDGKEYRVPVSVLEKLKEALKIKSDIKKFKVSRTGSGLNTKYSLEVVN